MPGRRLTALCLGGANTLEADKAAALELFTPDLIIACNHAGRDEPGRVDHWCTMHPDLMQLWLKERRRAGRPDAGQLWHAGHRHGGFEGSTPVRSWGGSSGMLCVTVAFELQCTHIVLAGIPMRKIYDHYDAPGAWYEARQYWGAWLRQKPIMEGRVKSLSGWTAEQLGVPTARWLDG